MPPVCREKGEVKRPKGFAPWNPQTKTRILLSDIEAVLEEYLSYLPLTVRQVFYRLVGKGYTKSESFYTQVQEACNRGRRSGRIPFAYVRDDGVSQLVGKSAPTRVLKSTTRATKSFPTTMSGPGTPTNQCSCRCSARPLAWCRCLRGP